MQSPTVTDESFHVIANEAPTAMWLADSKANYIFFNRPWLALTGLTLESQLGNNWLEHVHAEDRESCNAVYVDAFRQRTAFEREFRLRRHDGEYRWMYDQGSPRYSVGGKFEGYVGICIDITERKKHEDELSKTVSELSRSNKELEHFAYLASHDLQEPIRTVINFTQLLKERFEGKLDAETTQFLSLLVSEARRMKGLIEGLLTYSRVENEKSVICQFDCYNLVQSVMSSLQLCIEENGAEIICGPLPTLEGNANQIAQVFQNLLTNALKFRQDAPPRIQISSERRGKEWLFSLKDNGIGINMRYADRIFTIFQRLQKARYPGSGIGLSICKKIIELHGGSIWVESVPAEGSTFYFTLPATPSNDKGN